MGGTCRSAPLPPVKPARFLGNGDEAAQYVGVQHHERMIERAFMVFN